ncbi:MAG TPA: hypothetical protein VKB41_01460 [Steroidobacteraceae bacterium]|nr:hypothetical protein [Steroidobacteraceae bacterium]
MNRREFVGHASVATGLVCLGRALDVPAAASAMRANISVVIFDARYEDARRFAEALRRRGARPLSTRGDGSHLWAQDLAEVAQAGGRFAGLTPASDLLFAHDLARTAGLRLVHLAFHDSRAARTLVHRIEGRALGAHRGFDCNVQDWSAQLACALDQAMLDDRRHAANRQVITTRQPPATDFPGTLTSWVIA